MRGDDNSISHIVSSLLRKTLLFSLVCSAALFVFAYPLGQAIYHSEEAGRYIRLLSPLLPIMYTDMVTDGCLKGLGEQMWNMGVNILDSALGVLLVWTLLPKGALGAYIVIIYLDECINFALSMGRLRRVTRLRLFR